MIAESSVVPQGRPYAAAVADAYGRFGPGCVQHLPGRFRFLLHDAEARVLLAASSSAPPWPQLQGTVTANSIVLGPVTFHAVSAAVRILPTGAEITSLDAGILGGRVHATGSLLKPANDQDKPAYTFEGQFQKLSTTDVGALLGLRWAGGGFSGNGKIELSGYSANELAASAKGDLHFEWRNGAMGNQPSAASKADPVPAALGRFDRFTADASIASGAITLGQNQVISEARKKSVEATVTFGDPPIVTFSMTKETRTEKH